MALWKVNPFKRLYKVSSTGGSGAIGNNAVTTSKLQDIPQGSTFGRTSSGTGDPEVLDIDTTFKTALGLTKADVGLGSVDNTADLSKPISTATQSALDSKLNASAVSVFGASLIDDTNASEARTTLGLGSLATASTIVTSNITDKNVTLAKIEDLAAYSLIANNTNAVATATEVTFADLFTFLKQYITLPYGIAFSDETSAITVGDDKVKIITPFAMNVSSFKVYLSTAPVGSTFTVTVEKNGSLVATINVLSGQSVGTTLASVSFAENDVISVNVTAIGSTTSGAGAKLILTYTL